MTTAAATRTERYEVERVFGSAKAGSLAVARETEGNRHVTIKTLPPCGADAAGRTRLAAVLEEAHTFSELSHPNIVPLLELAEKAGAAQLVFEHVQGERLCDILAGGRQIPVNRALDLTIQMLKAVGFAHHKKRVHGDLKPASIILAKDDKVFVTDFCLAGVSLPHVPDDTTPCGSAAYVAPECVSGGSATPRADLFAVAMMLYQMLTGRTAASGATPAEVTKQIATAAFTPPSHINDKIDERLDDLLLKALAKDPDQRFDSAAKMEDALYLYLNPEPENSTAEESSDGTLGFLLRRMRHKSDFPALSATISAINRASADDDGGSTALSDSILKDFALTSKLLKTVNTAYFGNFSGTISTISKAVVVMGFDRIRNAAITLMLFEHLQNKAHAARLKDDLVASYFSGILARHLVQKIGIKSGEEAFICATFHNLGRLLTSFYFPEESREIEKLTSQKRTSETQASLQVLGVSYEALGIGVAKVWNFPARLVQSMRHIKEDRVQQPGTEEEKLRAVAGLSANVCDAMREGNALEREKRLGELARQYGDALGVSAQLMSTSIKQSAAALAKEAIALNIKTDGSAFLVATASAGDKAAAAETQAELQCLLSEAAMECDASMQQAHVPENPQRKAMLFDGIEDVTTKLMGDFKLNDVLRTILETMYRSMGFTRVLLYTRDTASNSMKSRFGFGVDVDKIVAGKFSIALGETKDVFQAAVANGADVFIQSVNAEAIRKHIPETYRRAIPAKSFALFPIVVKGKPVALFYGDSDVEGSIRFTADELSLLKTLRNQAVIAIKAA